MQKKQPKEKPMEFKIWLDQYGFFKMKFRGDPMHLAEGLGSLMTQNEKLKDVVTVAVKVNESYEKAEQQTPETVK